MLRKDYPKIKGHNIHAAIDVMTRGRFAKWFKAPKGKRVGATTNHPERVPDKLLDDILLEICEIFNISFASIVGGSRKRKVLIPRQIYFYVARVFLMGKRSWSSIGLAVCRDHTTAMYSRDTIRDYLEKKDPIIMEYWEIYLEQTKIFNDERYKKN